MKNFIYGKLRLHFALIVMLTTLLTIVGVGLLLFMLQNHYQWNMNLDGRYYIFFFVIVLSGVLTACITTFVGYRILYPIVVLRKSMNKVATGDFSVQLDGSPKISEVQQLYSDFNFMVKELRSIETLQNDFVANVSHEFKTPLSTIQGYVQLLQDPTMNETKRAELLQRLLDGTKQLTQLTDSILKITKIENQGLHLERSKFRLDEQIRQAILSLHPQWEKLNLNFNIELDHLVFNGNEELMYQAFLNIIDNAIKYNVTDGSITVDAHQTEEGAFQIAISDTGIGISPEVQSHLFDKFYQADKSRLNAGNGLGLPLVKQIVDLHHGTIDYQSEQGIGTKVTLTLPTEYSSSN